MTTIIIYDKDSRFNLNSAPGAGYHIAEYKQGVPSPYTSLSTDSPPEGQIIYPDSFNKYVVDTMTLNIVAPKIELLDDMVSKLYATLRHAVEYWSNDYHYPVYIGARSVYGKTTYYAIIRDFTFHDLPNPLDAVNGKYIVNTILTITRGLWSRVPPQLTPQKVMLPNGGIFPEKPIRMLERMDMGVEQDKLFLDSQTLQIETFSPYENIYMTNCYSFAHIDQVNYASEWTNRQPSMQGEGVGFAIAPGTTGAGSELVHQRLHLLSKYPFWGAVFSLSGVAVGQTGIRAYITEDDDEVFEIGTTYPSSNLDTGWRLGVFGGRFDTLGDAVITWRADPSLNGHFNPYGSPLWDPAYPAESWHLPKYKVSLRNWDDTQITQRAMQTNRPIYAPWCPYFDVRPISQGTFGRLKLVYKFFNHIADVDGNFWMHWTSGNSFMQDGGIMTDMMIAIMHESQNFPGASRMPACFYNFTEEMADANIPENHPFGVGGNVFTGTVGFATSPISPAGRALFVDAERHEHGLLDHIKTWPVKTLLIDDLPPGDYRVFLRYSLTARMPEDQETYTYNPDIPETATIRLGFSNVPPIPNGPSGYITKPHVVDRSTPYVGHNLTENIFNRDASYPFTAVPFINVADYGVVRINSAGGSVLSKGKTYISLYTRFSFSAQFVLVLHDVVMLPVNRQFMHFTGSRILSNRGGATVAGSPRDIQYESLYIDNFDGVETRGVTANHLYSAAPTGPNGEIIEPLTKLTAGDAIIHPNGVTRVWSFFYKRAPNGVIISNPNFIFSVRSYIADQQITLPSSAERLRSYVSVSPTQSDNTVTSTAVVL